MVIPGDIQAALLGMADSYDEEVCGFLGGIGDRVITVSFAANIHPAPWSGFIIHPDDYDKVAELWATEGIEPLAVFHSHPFTNAVPSPRDRELAHPDLLTVVVAPVDREVRAWKIEGTDAVEVSLSAD